MPLRNKAAVRTKVKASSKRSLSKEADSQRSGRVTRPASNPTRASMKVETRPEEPTPYQKKVADNTIARQIAKKGARENKKKTLTKFTLFPKLPSELRRAIWKFALPSKDVMIPLRFSWAPSRYDKLNNFYYPSLSSQCSPFYISSVFISMLSTCWESRAEYIKAHPKAVSDGHLGKIYYDPKATTIFVDNWRDWCDCLTVCEEAKRKVEGFTKDGSRDNKLPHWFEDVELLAMGYNNFNPRSWDPRNSIPVFGNNQESGNIELFKNLKKWVAIANTGTLGMGQRDNNAWVLKYQLELKKVEQALQVYKTQKNPFYNVPEIVYRDLTPGKEQVVMGNWG